MPSLSKRVELLASRLAAQVNSLAASSGWSPRTTAAATTTNLANNASDAATTMLLAKSFRLLTIKTDVPARVQLYGTAADRDADAGRAVGTDPALNAGVILDYVTPAGNTIYRLSPIVQGASTAAPPVSDIPMRVTNRSGAAGTVTVTLAWARTE